MIWLVEPIPVADSNPVGPDTCSFRSTIWHYATPCSAVLFRFLLGRVMVRLCDRDYVTTLASPRMSSNNCEFAGPYSIARFRLVLGVPMHVTFSGLMF